MKKMRIVSALCAAVLLLASCASEKPEEKPETVTGGAGRDPSSTEAAAQTEKPSGPVRLTFAAAGDNIVHESIYLEAAEKASAMASTDGYTGQYYFDSMYGDDVRKIISEADISFVNQEGPISGEDASGYPNFNAPAEAGDALVDLGFDIVNVANNHMLDMEHRTTGYKNTVEYWKTKDVLMVGGYENETDYETLRFIERDGVKIAVLSFTYGTNGYSVNKNSTCVVPLIDDDTITSRIAEAKKEADLVFVSMHWGDENVTAVNSEQLRLAKLIADAGADVVIGHHTHTIQPVEWVTGEKGNKTLVIYSLGNFISTQIKAVNLVGLIVTFDIVKDEGMGAYVENPVVIPTVTDYASDVTELDSQSLAKRYDVTVSLLENYSSVRAWDHGVNVWDAFDFNYLKQMVESVIDAKFLKPWN